MNTHDMLWLTAAGITGWLARHYLDHYNDWRRKRAAIRAYARQIKARRARGEW